MDAARGEMGTGHSERAGGALSEGRKGARAGGQPPQEVGRQLIGAFHG